MLNIKNLKTNNFGLGTAGFSGEGGGYGFGKNSTSDSVKVIQEAVESFGVQVFDTAPIYGFGEAERRLGLALKVSREKAFVITKTGVSWHSNKRVNMTNDPKETKKMLEDSLRRLDVDYIDGVLVHWPDKNVDIRKTYEVLAKAKQQDKIRYLGLSNTNEDEIRLASEVDSVDILQGECNIFEHNSFEKLISTNNCYSTSWGSFDKGIASGRVTMSRKFDSFDCRSWAPWWKKSNKENKIDYINNLKNKIKDAGGMDTESILMKLSIEAIKNTGVNCPLFGVKTLSDLESLHSVYHMEVNQMPISKKLLNNEL
tara:strand:- start:1921 stop:2859 length:939 start_codon:yes stop_codon:yes gene_type:complete